MFVYLKQHTNDLKVNRLIIPSEKITKIKYYTIKTIRIKV